MKHCFNLIKKQGESLEHKKAMVSHPNTEDFFIFGEKVLNDLYTVATLCRP